MAFFGKSLFLKDEEGGGGGIFVVVFITTATTTIEIHLCCVAFNHRLTDEKILLIWLQRTDPSLD